MIIVKYETEEEYQTIITDKVNLGYILVEVQNIAEGNFLGFQDSGWVPDVETSQSPLSEKVKTLELDMLNTQIALADTYEQLLSAQAETTSMQLALVDVYEQFLAISDV